VKKTLTEQKFKKQKLLHGTEPFKTTQ